MNNPLPGLPLVESPLFFGLLPELDLTEEQVRIGTDLYHNGYAVFDFQDAELHSRIERIRANLGPRYGPDFADPASDKTAGERRIQDAWQFDEDVWAIAANEHVIELLSKLYGRAAFPFQTLNFSVGTQQDAHTDIVHFSSQPQKFMCGVWLALEDIAPEAGPLLYYPGSHRWPVVDNAMIGRRGAGNPLSSAQDPFGEAWEALCQAYGVRAETFSAKKGQALIWCANLLHGGSPQTDPRLTRWSQVTHYYFEDCFYYTPAFSDEATGDLKIRQITAISDGKRRPNMYLGEELHPTSQPAWALETGAVSRSWLERLLGKA